MYKVVKHVTGLYHIHKGTIGIKFWKGYDNYEAMTDHAGGIYEFRCYFEAMKGIYHIGKNNEFGNYIRDQECVLESELGSKFDIDSVEIFCSKWRVHFTIGIKKFKVSMPITNRIERSFYGDDYADEIMELNRVVTELSKQIEDIIKANV
jgi:hypothetical protein